MLSCRVESHYLRAMGIDMKDVGQPNAKASNEKNQKWQFKTYDGNTGIFHKYINAPPTTDVLAPEVLDLTQRTKDFSHVSARANILDPE